MNANNEIRIPWRPALGLAFLALTTLGWISSPRNAQGRPMLLTPDVKAVGETLHLAEKVTMDLGLVDGELNDLLAGDPTDLFGQIAQRPKYLRAQPGNCPGS